jgi:hypothetical protein
MPGDLRLCYDGGAPRTAWHHLSQAAERAIADYHLVAPLAELDWDA